MKGAMMKRNKQHTSITKTWGGSIRLRSKCLSRPNANLLISCTLVRSSQILAPLNLKEPWHLVVLASGRRSKSLWRVLYEWKSREWLNSLK